MSFPDLQTLHLYLTVHELGNVTHAAERHGIAASSVTVSGCTIWKSIMAYLSLSATHVAWCQLRPETKWHAKPATSSLVPTLSKGL